MVGSGVVMMMMMRAVAVAVAVSRHYHPVCLVWSCCIFSIIRICLPLIIAVVCCRAVCRLFLVCSFCLVFISLSLLFMSSESPSMFCRLIPSYVFLSTHLLYIFHSPLHHGNYFRDQNVLTPRFVIYLPSSCLFIYAARLFTSHCLHSDILLSLHRLHSFYCSKKVEYRTGALRIVFTVVFSMEVGANSFTTVTHLSPFLYNFRLLFA